MGMFDYVDVGEPAVECPKCGRTLREWQSKDGACLMNTVYWFDVSNFYTSCNSCHEWVEYVRDTPEPPKRFDGYTMTRRRMGEMRGTDAQ